MPQDQVGGARRQPKPQQPARPSRPPQRQRLPQRPPQRRPQQPPVRFRPMPVRNSPPMLSGLVGAVGIVGVIVVLILAMGGLPSGGKGGGSTHHPSGTGKLPSVSIAGSLPCQLSDPGHNAACVKAKTYAKAKLVAMGQGAQFGCLDVLWNHESNWNAWAIGPATSKGNAQGIPQALGHGGVFGLGDWQAQVDWGLDYIYHNHNFSTPCEAWAWWQHPRAPPYDSNWY